MNRDGLFISLIIFWTLLAIFSNAFNVELSKTDIVGLYPDQSQYEQESYKVGLFDWLLKIPGINILVPLLNILTFQYTDTVPVWLTLLLDMTAIFTVFIVYTLIRSG